MRQFGLVMVSTALVIILLSGCSSPQEKAAKSQMKVSEAELKIKNERLRMIEQYKKCLKDAGNDAVKAESCDSVLKAIEALK